MKLSVLMPAYNEQATLAAAITRVLDVDYPCEVELIVVDDGSTDATDALLRAQCDVRVRVHRHPANRGKGAAIATAAGLAAGASGPTRCRSVMPRARVPRAKN